MPDEEFHLTVTELLEQWARSNLPRPEVMRVVGQERSARSHEIRDLLSRNVVPFGFYPAAPGREGRCWNRPAPPRRRCR